MTIATAAIPFSASASFYGSLNSPALGPTTLSITQQEFAHDVAVMSFWGADIDSPALTSGLPMLLSWGRPSAKRVFYGYVNHAERVNNAFPGVSYADRNSVIVTCVGASWFMKQTDTRVWYNYTASQVIAEIAALFRLDTNIVPDSTVWPSLQMAGKNYFQFCVMLAERIGYTFYCSGCQLVFKPRQTSPNNLGALAAVYDYRADPSGMPLFTPTLGATSPGGGQLANRKLAGINPRTNQVVYVEVAGSPSPTTLGAQANNPVFDKTEHFTVNSQAEANSRASGAGALNQLYITASALVGGNALVSQGSLIYVQNANGSENGLWWVCKVVHRLNKLTYEMDLTLGRDSLGATASMTVTLQIKTPPSASLIGAIWVAAA